ncbi:MAG: AmpG family muropeptide MFS transporter [Alphaproteobacteria bacterium]|nr:AmpG family muropeptide MFS transporter [Alphaproteobacteria bacterium]
MSSSAAARVRSWFAASAVYADRPVLVLLFFGFSSGLPLLLVFSTLSVRLVEEGVSLTNIGLFSLVGQPYVLKFLWAPAVDRLPLPVLTRLFGRRKAWMLLTQSATAAAILWLGVIDPVADPWLTALAAFIVATASATQDIVLDAYRVESLEERQLGAGAAIFVFGYRIGMLAAGAGALYAAEFSGWEGAYTVMAGLMAIGILATLISPEPKRPEEVRKPGIAAALKVAVIDPFREFVGRSGWVTILAFILFYKFGDAFAGTLANAFYVDIGFTKVEIANVSKLFGLAATLVGGFVGGVMVTRMGLLPSLMVCGILQMVSNLLFAAQAAIGPDVAFLTLTIGVENLAGGMGTAAFIAYLSSLCDIRFTATQYALLSSVMALARTYLAASGGFLAEEMGWVTFFIISTVAAVPGLLLLLKLMRDPVASPARLG